MFPENFDEISPSTPIVLLAYGAFGNKNVPYPRHFAKIIKKYRLRAVYVARRGFN